MRIILIENNWLEQNEIMKHGWGNGYVAVPKGHRFHGKDYNEMEVEVHGGLTYSGKAADFKTQKTEGVNDSDWIFGFDTAHYKDDLERWPKHAVRAEAQRLHDQLV